jgi:hypothetical protein
MSVVFKQGPHAAIPTHACGSNQRTLEKKSSSILLLDAKAWSHHVVGNSLGEQLVKVRIRPQRRQVGVFPQCLVVLEAVVQQGL